MSRVSVKYWHAATTLVALTTALLGVPAHAQIWGGVEGFVTAADSSGPILGVSVLVAGTRYGTATDVRGWYRMWIPADRYVFRFSAIGFESTTDSVDVNSGQTVRLDVVLRPATVELGEVLVQQSRAPAAAGVFSVDPRDGRDIPAPMQDLIRVLKTLPGVATNNELSGQVAVRGGGFNENLFFINGFEIYMPFRPRQGEQEGLSLLNVDLAESLTLYSGGFPVRYGGKLSSAVEVTYRRPEVSRERTSVSGHLSILDASASASGSSKDGRLGWVAGLRHSRPRRLFATQDLKGDYDPSFLDFQTSAQYRTRRGMEIELLAIAASYNYGLSPRSRRTYFIDAEGASQARLRYDRESFERDKYGTLFGGIRVSNSISGTLRAEHDASFFSTVETELFELGGTAYICSALADCETSTNETRFDDTKDNRVAVGTLTA